MIYKLLYKLLIRIYKLDDMMKLTPIEEFEMYNLPVDEALTNIKRLKLARTKHIIRMVDATPDEQKIIKGCILACEMEIFLHNECIKIRNDEKIEGFMERFKIFTLKQKTLESRFWKILQNKIGIFK